MNHSKCRFIVAAAIALVAFMPSFTEARQAPPSNPSSPPSSPPEPISACATALECGLSPEALVVADAAASVTSILFRINSAVDLRTILALKHADLVEAQMNHQHLAQQVSVEDSELATAQLAAKAAVDQAAAALEVARAQIFTLAVQDLSEASLQRLANWRASAQANVPTAYRVHNASEAQWHLIEGAIRSEKRAQRLGVQPTQSVIATLNSVRGDFDVIAAASRLNTHLANAQAAFADCLSTSQ